MSLEDTIVAIATPMGRSGVGVIRLSGPKSLKIVKKIAKHKNLPNRRAINTWIKLPNKKNLDSVIVLYMKGPKSYTGEDVVEISCHGSPPILQKTVKLAIDNGARLAMPGEFTKRAYLNGKLDLAQAEAVFDLIHAQTPEASALAAEQLGRGLGGEAKRMRQSLISLLAKMEAAIDFPDDQEEQGANKTKDEIKAILKEIGKMIKEAEYGRIYKEGLSTIIVGRPNVGKSSLLNALLRDQRAIVTDMPGTTRDLIEESISLEGMPIKIIDTAGLRQPKNKIEEAGVKKTGQELEAADLILAVFDGSVKLDNDDERLAERIRKQRAIIIINKIDLKRKISVFTMKKLVGSEKVIKISALKGRGIKKLEKAIINEAKRSAPRRTRLMINVRHKECLIRAKEALQNVVNSYKIKMTIEARAIDLKMAVVSLGEISGESVSEEIIEEIFGKFCVGK